MEPWWLNLYDENVGALLLSRPDDLPNQIANFLIEKLNLKAGQLVFDQCCGNGDIAFPLLARGCRIHGVDSCELYIKQANEQAIDQQAKFITADAAVYRTPIPADGGINWGTSFAYASTDDENLAMLYQMHASLKPGAKFALDFFNTAWILRNFKSTITKTEKTPTGEIHLTRHCEFDLKLGRMEQDWVIQQQNGASRVCHTSVRAYMPVDLLQLVEKAGFSDLQLFGDLQGGPISMDSERCYLVGSKVHA